MSPPHAAEGPEGPEKPLVNRPDIKLPPIPNGFRIRKRPLPNSLPTSRSRPSATILPDLDGYLPPPRASHTIIIKVSSSTSFMSLVRRVRKALEKSPTQAGGQTSRGLPLTARIAVLGVKQAPRRTGPIADALDDVVLVATGRAIEKAIEVGGFFTREKDLIVLARTRTLRAVDDLVAEEEEADVEERSRVRNVSCVEIGIRWA